MIKPCFFTVITTVAGFSSLILSGLLPVINFGWMMSVGVIISLLLTFIINKLLFKHMAAPGPWSGALSCRGAGYKPAPNHAAPPQALGCLSLDPLGRVRGQIKPANRLGWQRSRT